VFDRRVAHRLERGPNGCLLWTGAKNDKGYGQTTVGRRRYYVHRLAWERHTGASIPEGWVVMHICDQPDCAEPTHLRVGTQLENMQDASRKGRTTGGERSAQAKLTWEQVRIIRSRYARGESQAKLGAEFGTCRQNISRIVNEQAWRRECERRLNRAS
jgi:hypothetical protein